MSDIEKRDYIVYSSIIGLIKSYKIFLNLINHVMMLPIKRFDPLHILDSTNSSIKLDDTIISFLSRIESDIAKSGDKSTKTLLSNIKEILHFAPTFADGLCGEQNSCMSGFYIEKAGYLPELSKVVYEISQRIPLLQDSEISTLFESFYKVFQEEYVDNIKQLYKNGIKSVSTRYVISFLYKRPEYSTFMSILPRLRWKIYPYSNESNVFLLKRPMGLIYAYNNDYSRTLITTLLYDQTKERFAYFRNRNISYKIIGLVYMILDKIDPKSITIDMINDDFDRAMGDTYMFNKYVHRPYIYRNPDKFVTGTYFCREMASMKQRDFDNIIKSHPIYKNLVSHIIV